jgi:Tfp pilus assembly protein PilX
MLIKNNFSALDLDSRSNRQQGAVSLLIVVVLLALMVPIVQFTSRSILMEQKIATNDFRNKQAFEAAEFGLQSAIAYIKENPDLDGDGEVSDELIFDTDEDDITDSNTMTLSNFSSTTVTLSGTTLQTVVTSRGFSDDNTATRKITTTVMLASALPNIPGNPLTTRGAVVIQGSATVHNKEGHSTIWSGDDIDLGSNNSTGTEIADPSDAAYPTCMDTADTCGLVASSNKVSIGLDVIEYDADLANISGSDLFKNYFGYSPAQYRDNFATMEIDIAAGDSLATAHLSDSEVIWVDGNTTWGGGGLTVGCSSSVTGNNVCALTDVTPSILIVDGDLTVSSGTPQFYGFIFVTGSLISGGNTTLHGAAVVAGNTTSSTGGSFDVWYRSDLLASLQLIGAVSSTPGSWKDWD